MRSTIVPHSERTKTEKRKRERVEEEKNILRRREKIQDDYERNRSVKIDDKTSGESPPQINAIKDRNIYINAPQIIFALDFHISNYRDN